MGDNNNAAEEYARWITPKAAVQMCEPMGTRTAIDAIYRRLCSGLIQSIARHVAFNGRKEEYFRPTESMWRSASEGISVSSFWYDAGDITFYVNGRSAYDSIPLQTFNVRLDVDAMRAWLPPPAAPLVLAEKGKNPGGRPRKEFWDDLLIAIFQRIYSGDFKPKRQAELEAAMLDWAAQNGHELSESSVKGPAKKLLKALKD